MATSNRLGVRVKPNDEILLQKLADLLERNLSDTIRFAVRFTARHHGLLQDKKPANIAQIKLGNKS